MKIKAKMQCEEVAKVTLPYSTDPQERVKLRAVYSDSEENKTFSDATPAASVEMTITNPAAFGAFVAGREYYLDFTPAQ